jgi:NAD-dependent DNA ligase
MGQEKRKINRLQEIREFLKSWLKRLNHLYRIGIPQVSDQEYDDLLSRAQQLQG